MIEPSTETMKRIRIIKHHKKPSFAEQLEAQARALVKNTAASRSNRGVESALEGELALVVSHIDSVRSVHADLRRSLLRQECYLGTEILQRTPPDPVYYDPRLAERDTLRDRLRDVEKERRRLVLQEEETIRGLRDRLGDACSRDTAIRPSRTATANQ